ncbi:MAG: thermonuclease family protein [Betaproteobacteria bacterium]
MRLFLLLLVFSLQVSAADRKEWSTLTDCRYVAHHNNDGDSFHVRCGADEFVLRLYFVDTPETNLAYAERTREQAEHFGATLDETLKAGKAAGAYVRDALSKPFVVLTRKAYAQGAAKDPRYYGMVQVGGKDAGKGLDEILVLAGLARVKGVNVNIPGGEKSRAHVQRLLVLEEHAKQKRRGLWASAR